MYINFHKINPQEYHLHVKREDGSEEEAVLEYRSYLKHDLVHFVLEKNAGIQTGFFGKIAGGATLEELSPKNIRASGKEDPDLMLVEIMVGSVQGMLKSGETNADKLKEYIRLQKLQPPSYLNGAFLRSVIREVRGLIKRYESMKVGESLEMEFFEHEPAKSYCADPKSMADVFARLNKLGKSEK